MKPHYLRTDRLHPLRTTLMRIANRGRVSSPGGIYAVRCLFRSMIPSNAAPPTAIIDHGEGSGTGVTRSPVGALRPLMKLALIAAPVEASYSPTVVPPF